MPEKLRNQIKPDWDEIEKIREEASDFIRSRNYSDSIADAVVMVISELIENAIKYGVYLKPDDSIDYSLTIERDTIIIEVMNPFRENENFRKLDMTVQWIRGFQNPFQAYIEKIKEISGRPLEDKESGLGLVRIAYQGRSIIDFYLKNSTTIAVSAVYQI